MSIKLDLNQFKHMHSGKDTTTLLHPSGHTVTLAHKALSPASQKQLQALAGLSKSAQTPADVNEARDQKLADGGNVYSKPQMKEEYKQKNHPAPNSGGSMDYKNFPKENANKNAQYKEQERSQPRKKYADGSTNVGGSVPEEEQGIGAAFNSLFGDNDTPSSNVFAKRHGIQVAANDPQPTATPGDWGGSAGTMRAAPASPQPGVDPADMAPAEEGSDDRAPAANEGPVGQAQPGTDMNGNRLGPDGKPVIAPQQAAQPANGEEPDAQQPQEQQQPQAPAATFQDHKANIQQDLSKEDQAWNQDLMNGHIQPKTYADLFADKSTLGKVGTIFGLMLGGIGSGLTHQPNALLEMMNNTIKNDVDAQKASKDNAQNFYKLSMQNQVNQGTLKKMVQDGILTESQAAHTLAEANIKADALTHMHANRAALHDLSTLVDSLPPGSRNRQQAEQTLAMLNQGVNQDNADLADRAATGAAYAKMLMGNSGQPGGATGEQAFQQQNKMMKAIGTPEMKEMAKDNEEKHFPGLPGQASEPLKDATRDQLTTGMDFDKKLQRFTDWTKNHSGDLNPKDRNVGQTLAAELQGAYRQATHGGVYKEGEQNFISKLIDSTPTKFFNSVRVTPQLEALGNEHKQRMDNLAKSVGFQGYPGAQQPQQQQQNGAQPQYKIYNRVKYMRGPNGEAIPVK